MAVTMPRISVVIPSYNHAPYIHEAIDSVLGQTRPPDEVIVVDDGSTDESVELLHEYGDRIRLEVQENRGTYATLNRAFAMATGDWIAIQNSDDVWRQEKLEHHLSLAESQPEIGFLHTGFEVIDSDGRPVVPKPSSVPDWHGPPIADMLPTLIHEMPVIISSAMVSRSAWERHGPFDPRFLGAGDWDFCLRLSQEFPFGFVDQPLTLHRKHAANATTDSARIPPTWVEHDMRILRSETMPTAARTLFEKARRDELDPTAAAHSLACLGVIYSQHKERAPARAAYLRSLRLNPLRLKTWIRLTSTLLR